MNRFIIYLLCSTLFFILSCKNQKKETDKPETKSTVTDTVKAFPVIDLLRNDVEDVLKTPYYMYKITSKNFKRTDSAQIKIDELSAIIKPLLGIDIIAEKSAGKFKEIVFEDLSTSSISIIHTALDATSQVKSISTLLNNKNNKLKSIYIVTETKQGDNAVKKSYFWKAGKSLTIATSITQPNGSNSEMSEYINWNDNQ